MKIQTDHIPGFSAPNYCFKNVARLVAERGGRAVYGWLASEVNGDDIRQLVHHCVWENPAGELVDVTPQITYLDDDYHAYELPLEVDFIPDDSATLVDGRSLPPRFEALRPQFAKAAQYIGQAEGRALAGDLNGANYWTDRANTELAKHHRGRRGFAGWNHYTATTLGMLA